ncbi:MAG: hypothetical protein K9J25_02155 [Bacteroidales bacterium]|nr:hypothetical protein [Bacteroidales bacterium]
MRTLTKISIFSALIVLLLSSCVSKKEERTLHIFATTDVHGYVFDKDPYTGNTSQTSMARLETYLKGFSRDEYILLDNGDNLQGNWIATMNRPDGDLFETEYSGNMYRFKNRTYNFDSAEGINYVVDVSKPDGDKVYISTLTDGRKYKKLFNNE